MLLLPTAVAYSAPPDAGITLRTRPGFAGSTAEGARVEDDRARIMQPCGAPRRQYAGAAWWHYGDIGFWFDGRGRAGRMDARNRR